MKKHCKTSLFWLSITALGISAVTFSNPYKKYVSEGMIDENHYRESIYDEPGIKPVKMNIMDYNDYTLNPTSEPKYNTQKDYHISSLDIGTVWDTNRGDGVTIAVIDTGVNYSHEDFVYYNSTGTSISSLSADFEDPNGTGTVTKKTVANYGWSVMEDANGHGTNVASTIASRINGKGCAGVAPNVNLLFCKCPNLMSSEVSAAIRYATDNGADIITMSLGMYKTSFKSPYTGETVTYSASADSFFSSAINYAHNNGVIVFAAAGNDNTSEKSYPACNNYVIGVGALAAKSRTSKANYSNFNSSTDTQSGNHNVDVTVCGSVYVATKTSNSSYDKTAGTSFSCPITAAAMALYLQSHPEADVSKATQALYDSCDDIGSTGWDATYGYGCVSISKLVGISYDVNDINLSTSSISLYSNGESTSITASVVPSYATNKKIKWSISDSNVATLSSTESTSENPITVTAKGVGNTTITAESDENNSIQATCSVEVKQYTDSSFEIVLDSTTMVVGESQQLNVNWLSGTPTYSDLEYDSSDSSVASISDSGMIKALKAGTTTIGVVSTDDYQEVELTVSGDSAHTWELVTSTSGLVSGNQYVLVGIKDANAHVNGGITGDNGYLDAVTVTISNNSFATLPTGGEALTLSGEADAWKFTFSSGAPLNYSGTSVSNKGTPQSTYKISINGTSYKVTIKAGSNYLTYNSSSPRFKPYGNENNGNTYLYRKVYESGGDTNPTVSKVTVTAAGDATSVSVGSTLQLSAVVTGTNNPAQTVTWRSGDTSKATVSNSGVVTGVAAGTVSIYAKSTVDTSKEGSISLTITSSGSNPDYGTYYNGITATGGTLLLGQLHDLSVTEHTNYNAYSSDLNTTNYFKTDPYNTSNTVIRDFYTGAAVKNGVVSSGSNGWNREHVWCQDLSNGLYGQSGAGADIQHLRPTIATINSARGNKKYGELNNSGTASTASDYYGNTVTGGYYTSSVFQPIASKKGDVARIIMYLYMHYNKAINIDGTKDGSTSSYFGTLKFTHVMSANDEDAAIELLLSWNASDPVDDIERTRNTEAAKITGCRNPFIDHSEYAVAIWGETPSTKTLSSIGVSGQKISFNVGDTFSFGGTVTATYNDYTTANVTSSATFSGYDMNKSGEQTVTVSYTENNVTKYTTYKITVEDSGGSTPGDGTWVKCESSADLVDGNYYMFVTPAYDSKYYYVPAVDAEVGAGNFSKASSSYVKSSTSPTSLGLSDSGWKISIQSGTPTKYIFSSVNNKNIYLSSSSDNNGLQTTKVSSTWTLDIQNKNFAFKNSSNSRYLCSYNTSPYGFRTYTGTNTNGTAYLSLYKWVENQSTPKVNSITLDKINLSLDVYNNKTYTLTPTISADAGVDTTVSWSSDCPQYATVNNGLVTAVAEGIAVITATCGGKIATCTVTVTDSTPKLVTSVTITSKLTQLEKGKTGTLTASVAPDNATNKTLQWSTSNSSNVSIVGATTGNSITISAIGNAGSSSVLTASATDGSGKSASVTVTIIAQNVIESIRIDTDETSIPFGKYTESHTITATVKAVWSNGSETDVTSSATKDFDIDSKILGKQSITASYEGFSASKDILVTNEDSLSLGFVGVANQGIPKTDTLTAGDFKATTTNYVDFSGVTKNNGAVYAGQSAKDGSGNIQIRSKNENSGIVQTTSGGKVTSISVVVGNGNKTLNIYGKNTAYSSAADLYDSSKRGTLIGTISATGEVTFTSDKQYEYVGVRSSDGAIYLTSISFTYGGGGKTYNASPTDQAESWAEYFIRETRTDDTCLAALDSDKLAGLQAKWSTLADEYNWMIGASKDAFCSKDATGTIAIAMQHYQYITTKFSTLDKFVTDSSNNAPKIENRNSIIGGKLETSTIITASIAMLGSVAIAGYFFYKKRKEQ